MPKRLIKLEFIHVPEEHFGALWLFFEEHPGIQFKHQTPARSTGDAVGPVKGKRVHGNVAAGTTGKCIVLTALADDEDGMSTGALTQLLVRKGKSPKSVGNVLHELNKTKLIRKDEDEGWVITAAGVKFRATNCTAKPAKKE